MEQQMEKNFWCRIEHKMCRFIQHAINKNRYICCTCGYETSNPEKESPKSRKEHHFNYI